MVLIVRERLQEKSLSDDVRIFSKQSIIIKGLYIQLKGKFLV